MSYAPAYYSQNAMMQSKQQPTYYQSAVPSSSSSTLAFSDANTLLNYMSTLPSPSALLSVSTLSVSLPSSSSSSASLPRAQVGQVTMALHLMLRYAHALSSLTIDWSDCPSSVLTGISFRLSSFTSTMYVDGTVIAFLESQPSMRSLELPAWGAHLSPRNSGGMQMSAMAPPMLAPAALPALEEFAGHAEVAAQLASAGRPLQYIHLSSGLPMPSPSSSSGALMAEWREIMGGLAGSGSPMGVRELEIDGLERIGSLECMAEMGRSMRDLEVLRLRVRRSTSTGDILRFEHWKNYLTPLANLERIEISFFTAPLCAMSSLPVPIVPSPAHIQQWHNTCPLLSSVSVTITDAYTPSGTKLCAWEWSSRSLRWVDRASRA